MAEEVKSYRERRQETRAAARANRESPEDRQARIAENRKEHDAKKAEERAERAEKRAEREANAPEKPVKTPEAVPPAMKAESFNQLYKPPAIDKPAAVPESTPKLLAPVTAEGRPIMVGLQSEPGAQPAPHMLFHDGKGGIVAMSLPETRQMYKHEISDRIDGIEKQMRQDYSKVKPTDIADLQSLSAARKNFQQPFLKSEQGIANGTIKPTGLPQVEAGAVRIAQYDVEGGDRTVERKFKAEPAADGAARMKQGRDEAPEVKSRQERYAEARAKRSEEHDKGVEAAHDKKIAERKAKGEPTTLEEADAMHKKGREERMAGLESRREARRAAEAGGIYPDDPKRITNPSLKTAESYANAIERQGPITRFEEMSPQQQRMTITMLDKINKVDVEKLSGVSVEAYNKVQDIAARAGIEAKPDGDFDIQALKERASFKHGPRSEVPDVAPPVAVAPSSSSSGGFAPA